MVFILIKDYFIFIKLLRGRDDVHPFQGFTMYSLHHFADARVCGRTRTLRVRISHSKYSITKPHILWGFVIDAQQTGLELLYIFIKQKHPTLHVVGVIVTNVVLGFHHSTTACSGGFTQDGEWFVYSLGPK